jgi:glycosyltransferase involved in cell wall biosynthesis
MAERTPLLRRLSRRTLRASGSITAVSDDLRRRVEDLGADPAATSTVHLGVDTEAFAPRPVDQALRARLGAADGTLLVVAVGRLVEKKGFRFLIEAVSRIDRTHVTIIGDGDLRPELEEVARLSGASVSFTGNLDQPAVSEALAAADVVAVPSVVDEEGNVDGLPTTVLEALSTGRAIVASAIAGIPEVVRDRVNGLLVEEKDVAGLADALTKLRDQPQLRRRLGQEARRSAVSDLDWASTAEAFENAYLSARARSSR